MTWVAPYRGNRTWSKLPPPALETGNTTGNPTPLSLQGSLCPRHTIGPVTILRTDLTKAEDTACTHAHSILSPLLSLNRKSSPPDWQKTGVEQTLKPCRSVRAIPPLTPGGKKGVSMPRRGEDPRCMSLEKTPFLKYVYTLKHIQHLIPSFK